MRSTISERSWLPPPPGYPRNPPRQVKRRRFAEPIGTMAVEAKGFSHPLLRAESTRRWADAEFDECVTEHPRPLCRCGAYRLAWPA